MHLLRDLAPMEAPFGQPDAGALGGALDQSKVAVSLFAHLFQALWRALTDGTFTRQC
jgi:hypothetical protein